MPDRPSGRGRALHISPVKQLALEHGLPLLQPRSLRRDEAFADLCRWRADVFVVAAFGQILPQRVLDIPSRGSLNIHASLLPRWRGAAPMQAAIRNGDTHSGASIMQMEAGLDSGPVLAQQAVPLAPDETAQSLHDRLAPLGAELLMAMLPDWLAGGIDAQTQDEALVTLAPQLRKQDGLIDWSLTADSIERQVRAYTPWPGSFTAWGGRQLKILEATVAQGRQHQDRSWRMRRESLLVLARLCCCLCVCNWQAAARRLAMLSCVVSATSSARSWAQRLSSPAHPPLT